MLRHGFVRAALGLGVLLALIGAADFPAPGHCGEAPSLDTQAFAASSDQAIRSVMAEGFSTVFIGALALVGLPWLLAGFALVVSSVPWWSLKSSHRPGSDA